MENLIDLLLKAKVLGKGLKATENAPKRLENNKDLLDRLLKRTAYLDDKASIYERLLNVRLGITELPRCEECQSGLTGRIWQCKYARFCCARCRHDFVTKKRVENLTDESNGVSKIKQMAQRHLEKERSTFIDGVSLVEIRTEKARKTRVAKGHIVDRDNPNQVDAQRRYRMEVGRLTYKQPLHLLANIEKRGHIENGGWHLDHCFSVNEGFLKGVPAEVIANICNLKMIPGHENVVKQEKSSISLEHLMFEYDRQIHRQVSLTNSSDHQPSES
jgi:hypothetical protein